jgi:hypothetical protein
MSQLFQKCKAGNHKILHQMRHDAQNQLVEKGVNKALIELLCE